MSGIEGIPAREFRGRWGLAWQPPGGHRDRQVPPQPGQGKLMATARAAESWGGSQPSAPPGVPSLELSSLLPRPAPELCPPQCQPERAEGWGALQAGLGWGHSGVLPGQGL